MSNATVYVALTPENVQHVKRALRARFADVQSSHLTEALAAALGRNTHAALLADLSAREGSDAEFTPLDEGAFTARLAELNRRVSPWRSRGGLFHDLTYPKGAEVIRTWSPGFDRVRYNVARRRAWRNMMIAAINAGIDQRLFSVRAGDNRWPGAEERARHRNAPPHCYRFEVCGIPAVATVNDAGWDELLVHVVLWPTEHASQWIDVLGSGFRAGDAHASGWLERRDGAFLQASQRGLLFHCRKVRLATVAALNVEPHCYADRGSFYM